MSGELTTIDAEQPSREGALSDLRQFAMALPADRIQEGLAEYMDRRKTFREWLRQQLVEGVHYGYPPGVVPKYNERDEQLAWKPGKGGKDGRMEVLPREQWTFKPSLYKAGADFICDLLGLRDEYRADMDSHAQMGSPKDTFVMGCYLCSRASGALVGEGRGVRTVGQKGGDANNAIKMAKKCAKVDAVLNAYGLADLFTQDIEDMAEKPDPHENPLQREDRLRVPTRAKRTQPNAKQDRVNDIWAAWEDQIGTTVSEAERPPAFYAWVVKATGRSKYPRSTEDWTDADFDKCCDSLNIPKGGA